MYRLSIRSLRTSPSNEKRPLKTARLSRAMIHSVYQRLWLIGKIKFYYKPILAHELFAKSESGNEWVRELKERLKSIFKFFFFPKWSMLIDTLWALFIKDYAGKRWSREVCYFSFSVIFLSMKPFRISGFEKIRFLIKIHETSWRSIEMHFLVSTRYYQARLVRFLVHVKITIEQMKSSHWKIGTKM